MIEMNCVSFCSCWRRLLFAAVTASASLIGSLNLHAAAPSVALEPSNATISAVSNPDKSADFIFDMPMDRTGIDVIWSGAGIDSSMISYVWTPMTIPGFDIPALSLECTYAGGWPSGVVVTWTLNNGNSGVIKSAAGTPLEEHTGMFTTPGTSGEVVTITPSATEVTVGETLTFTFSAAMDTAVLASAIFQPSDGTWMSTWQSSIVLKCTLQGGIDAGETVSAHYTLSDMKTAGGQTVADFTRAISLRGMNVEEPDPPQLVSGPSTEVISGTLGKAYFVFDQVMNPSGLDIMWSGAGIDPSKITVKWLVTTIGGITLPVNTIEAEYQAGWPRDTDVTYVLNSGDSGVIKSAANVALLEISDTFRTPVSGPGTNPGTPGVTNCPVDPAPGTDFGGAVSMIKEINYLQPGPASLIFDSVRKAIVRASVIASFSNTPPQLATSATLNRPVGGSVALEKLTIELPGGPVLEIPDSFFLSTTAPPAIMFPEFASMAELDAAYPNGN